MFCLYNTSNFTCFTFFCSQKKVTKKTCSVFLLFRYVMPDAVTAPSAIIKIFSQTSYPSPLNAARSSTDSLRSPTPGVPPAFLVAQSVDFPFNFATYPIANTKWKRVSLASRRSLLGNFLPSLTSLALVNRSLFAGLTALISLSSLISVFNFR